MLLLLLDEMKLNFVFVVFVEVIKILILGRPLAKDIGTARCTFDREREREVD